MVVRPSSFDYDSLISCAKGKLFGIGNAQLPMPNMLMFDRITHISDKGGEFDQGQVIAELDVHPDLWFFKCHFENDPVMPGCLGLDAMWQMVGFFLGWLGGEGSGRALGLGNLKFNGQILPTAKKVIYKVNMKRVMMRKLILGIADGILYVDGQEAYHANDLKVGLFKKAPSS